MKDQCHYSGKLFQKANHKSKVPALGIDSISLIISQ